MHHISRDFSNRGNSISLLNETHDPTLRSRVDSANQPDGDLPIQNLPFAVFRRKGVQEPWRGGVAIGECIVDLAAAAQRTGLFEGADRKHAGRAS
jgi:fumarylacetoacetase